MLFRSLPAYYNLIHNTLLNSPNLILQQLSWQFPSELPALHLIQQTSASETAPDSVAEILIYVDWLLTGLFIATATLVLSFFWILDSDRSIRALLLLLPLHLRDDTRTLITEMEGKVGAYVRGQTILCLAIGSLALIAYLLIGLPYALTLAFFAGLMEAIPWVGPTLGAIPAVMVAAVSGDPSQVVWVIVATLVIQQLENAFLLPRVMDQSVKVNPIVTLLALFTLGSSLGVPGALVAIPLAAILQLLLDRFVLNNRALERELPEGRGQISKLRYQVNELIQDARHQLKQKTVEDQSDVDLQPEEQIESIAADLDNILALLESPEPAP